MRWGRMALAAGLLAAAAGGAVWWWRGRPAEEARPERPPTAVVLVEAKREEFVRRVEAVGTVAAVDRVMLATPLAGRVVEVSFDQGQRVEAGAVLARLDRDEQEAEVAAAGAEAAEVGQALARGEELLRTGNAPRATVEDARRRLQAALARLRSAQSRLEDTEIRAPFEGRVGLRQVSPGAVVAAGAAVATLDSVDPIALRFAVPEGQIGRLEVGAAVEATSPAYPGRTFRGTVHALDGRVDPATRTLEVEARLPNADGALRPGMLLNLRVEVGRVADAVTLPPGAVLLRGTEHYVFRVREDKAERVPVRIGAREPERIEVLEGISAGDRVVAEGGDALADGAPVKARENEEQPGAPPNARDGAPPTARRDTARPSRG